MSLSERLAKATEHASAEWRVELLDLSNPDDLARLTELFDVGKVRSVHDEIADQLTEFVRTNHPRHAPRPADIQDWILIETKGRALLEYGRWAFYPWSGRLIHLLPADAFRKLRSDRNRHKISNAEQEMLRTRTIGVVGLSVGLSVAMTLALEGVGGRIRLADFDALGLSNLNRLSAGVHNLGVNKAVLAARQMLELDPYLEVEVFPDGVTEQQLDRFFGGDHPLDLLIEECDDLYMKVRLREVARHHRIPVIMETSDRGLIDIERFDLETNRPLLHGLVGDVRSADLRSLETKDKVPFILRILDGDRLSPGACASLLEIKETISTWPQPGSSVTLGGAVVTDTARRILLGTFTESGRYYVDLSTIVSDGKSVTLNPATPPVEQIAKPEPTPPIPHATTGCPPATDEEIRWIVTHGGLAPSGGNAQPWKFEWTGDILSGGLDAARRSPLLDFEFTASIVALGAAAENMSLASRRLGLSHEIKFVESVNNADCRFELALQRQPSVAGPDDLFEQIAHRTTNRRTHPRIPLTSEQRQALEQEAEQAGASLVLITDADQLEQAGEIIGSGDQLRFLSPGMHREIVSELRWTTEEAMATLDGIDLATLEVAPADRAILKLLASWPTMSRLKEIGGGTGLGKPSRDAVRAASAVGLIRYPRTTQSSFFHGGRALQRVWLRATALGLAFQPMSVLPYLFARLERGGGVGLTDPEKQLLRTLRVQFHDLFGLTEDRAEILLFRTAHAPPPTARSLRRPVIDILSTRTPL